MTYSLTTGNPGPDEATVTFYDEADSWPVGQLVRRGFEDGSTTEWVVYERTVGAFTECRLRRR